MVSAGKGDFDIENAIVLNHGQNERIYCVCVCVWDQKIKKLQKSASIKYKWAASDLIARI